MWARGRPPLGCRWSPRPLAVCRLRVTREPAVTSSWGRRWQQAQDRKRRACLVRCPAGLGPSDGTDRTSIRHPPQPGVSRHGKPSCVTWVPHRPGLSASSQCLPLTDAAPALARQILLGQRESGEPESWCREGYGHGVPDGQGLLDLEGQMRVSEHLCRTRLPAEALGCSGGGGGRSWSPGRDSWMPGRGCGWTGLSVSSPLSPASWALGASPLCCGMGPRLWGPPQLCF